MEGRAAAAAAREDKIAAAAQAQAEAEAEADWRPRRDAPAGPRAAPRVGKLFGMCLALLVEHIDDVETLYGLPTVIKVYHHSCLLFTPKSIPTSLHVGDCFVPTTCVPCMIHSASSIWDWVLFAGGICC